MFFFRTYACHVCHVIFIMIGSEAQVMFHIRSLRFCLKRVMININVSNRCCYAYLNYCADGHKYIVLNDTQQDATRKETR
jgi:hypothetical protein